MDIQAKSTFLSEFQPKNLAKHLQKNEWIFAEYHEKPEQRTDQKAYRAFTFRNKDRTVFGVKEFYDQPSIDFRQLASRVVTDKTFREGLVSDDEDLRKIWKRH
ncbi:MAG TPA: hypothetical protein VF692_12065 [Pyrinomonadaceae bacterium]